MRGGNRRGDCCAGTVHQICRAVSRLYPVIVNCYFTETWVKCKTYYDNTLFEVLW